MLPVQARLPFSSRAGAEVLADGPALVTVLEAPVFPRRTRGQSRMLWPPGEFGEASRANAGEPTQAPELQTPSFGMHNNRKKIMEAKMLARHLRLVPAGSHADDPDSPKPGSQDGARSPNALPYVIELWDTNGAIEAVLGQLRDATMAWSGYYTAVRTYTGRKITLRLGANVLANSVFPK